MAGQGLLPGYLIVGSDELKSSRAVERMRARLGKSGMVEFNLDERDMTKDPQVDDIVASLNTFPMGAEFRLVILTNCDKLPKAMSEPLVEYFANPSPTTVCWWWPPLLPRTRACIRRSRSLAIKRLSTVRPKRHGRCRPRWSRWQQLMEGDGPSRRRRRWLRARERTPGCLTTSSRSSRPWSQVRDNACRY